MKILIVPFQTEEKLARKVENLLEDFSPEIKAEVTSKRKIPAEFFDEKRGQLRSELFLQWLENLREEDALVAIADCDAYDDALNFVFGEASPLTKVCAVYLQRLRPEFYKSRELFIERLEKEVLHEFAHLFGLQHCKNKQCNMVFSNSIVDVDLKGLKFCDSCFRKFPIKVNKNYLLT